MADCEHCAALRAAITQDMNDILAPKGTISEMIGTLRHLRAEVSELNELFDARWSADMRAIECWRKLNPGNDLVLPDHVNLCLWLMEERTRLAAEVDRLRTALDEAQREITQLYEDAAGESM